MAGAGIIDFYFACEDKWMFDLAVACNDWCVDESNGELDPARTQRPARRLPVRCARCSRPSGGAWPMMLRAAALRFWLSRLYDHYLPRDAEVLSPKDPRWFERILHARRAGRNGNRLMQVRRVPALAGWRWVTEGFAILAASPMPLIASGILMLFTLLVLSAPPVLGAVPAAGAVAGAVLRLPAGHPARAGRQAAAPWTLFSGLRPAGRAPPCARC